MNRKTAPKLLYLVAEDWAFVSHRLGLALAAMEAGYDVVVATAHWQGGPNDTRGGASGDLDPDFEVGPQSLF